MNSRREFWGSAIPGNSRQFPNGNSRWPWTWRGVLKKTGKLFRLSCFQNYWRDSNHILQTDEDLQILFADGPKMCPTNPIWRTTAILKKMRNRYMSTTVWPILTVRYMTCFHERICFLVVPLILLPILGVKKCHNTTIFTYFCMGVFKPNVQNIEACYRNYWSDSKETLESHKDLQILFVGGPEMCPSHKMANGGHIHWQWTIAISQQPCDRLWRKIRWKKGSTQGCVFLGLIDTVPLLGVKCPKNPILGA